VKSSAFSHFQVLYIVKGFGIFPTRKMRRILGKEYSFPIYEVSTSCGGSERLYDKMKRLIKSETFKTPADKTEEVRYNTDHNLFVRRSLQEE